MRDDIVGQGKKCLRESWITRDAYRGAARLLLLARLMLNRLRFGRYYPAEFFNSRFARDSDPWAYQGDLVSERRKALILSQLPTGRTPRLLELGCAAGWMTADLAGHADAVTAVDISPVALNLAMARCSQLKHVSFRRQDLLTEIPEESFDVIVCAGVLVFIPWTAQSGVRDKVVEALAPGGILLLEHTRDAFPGEVAGKDAHALYAQHSELMLRHRISEDIYEILVFQRIVVSGQSEAEAKR